MDLPIYEMKINPSEDSDIEVMAVALVDKPAIERNFMMFKDGYGGPGSGPQGGDSGDDSADVESMTDSELTDYKNNSLKKADELIAKKKKLYPNPDIETAMSPEEKALNTEIAKHMSNANKAVVERRSRIKKDGVKMLSNKLLNFAVDNDKRIISGPAMVADVPIYRKDEGGEYNVFFSAATIKEIALKFAKKGYAKKLNLFHDPALPADGVAIFNSFVSDKSMGILPMAGFEDLPDGSWFISAKVENEEIWKRIKAGEVRGFSVEGNFSFDRSEQSGQKKDLIENAGIMQELKTLLTTLKSALFSADNPPPPATPPAAAPVAAEAVKAKLKDGTEISVSEMVVGGVVMVGDAPAPAGEHELEDGTKITVGEGGVISAVTPGTSGAPPPMDYTKEFAAVNEKFAGYEAKLNGYEERFAKQDAAITKAQAINEQLFAIVQKLAETPTADPVQGSGSNFATQKSQDRDERLREISENIKKLKTA